MTGLSQKGKVRRGRILDYDPIPKEELAKRKAIRDEQSKRSRVIFERLLPQLREKYYNWFIAIEPDSGEYLLHTKLEDLIDKVKKQYHPEHVPLTIFRLNESGACGKI